MPIPAPAPDPPSKPIRKPRTLPIPRTALSALDSARTCAPSDLETHLRVLQPHFSDPTALEYITKRLHNGLTTSKARLNYSVLLCAITRITKSSALLNAPYPQYSTPREEALARVSLIAALVRAGVREPSMVSTLRQIACAENGRWRLGDACVTLVKPLLSKPDHSVLREWCRETRFLGHGLYLACILLREGILSDKAFSKIYRSRDDIRKALMEATDTGFSMIAKDDIKVPPIWLEALSAKHELLGLSAWQFLQVPSVGVEKKLLTITLLPTVAKFVSSETFDRVFTSHVGKVSKALCAMHDYRGARIRLERVTESAKRAVKKVYDRIGQETWAQLSKVTREVEEADQLCTRFLLWSVRNGIVHRLFPKLDILTDMEESLSTKLFDATVREYAKTRDTGVRSSLLRFLFVLAVKGGFVEDAVKVVAMYAAFEGGKDASFKLERFTSADGDTFAGCLPQPSPQLSQSDAGVAFRRLVEFCADQRIASTCLTVLRRGLESGMKPRFALRSDADQDLKEAIFRVVDSISRPAEPIDKPLVDSLLIAAEFVAIQYLAPMEHTEDWHKSMAEFESLLASLDACVSSVFDAGEKEDGGEPMPVERVTHLITDLCGHESASFRQISVKAVEALGSRLDDTVTAVLFDALESYVAGSGAVGKEDDMVDEDEEEGENEEGENGGAGDHQSGVDDDYNGDEKSDEEKSGDGVGMNESASVGNNKQGEEGSEDDSVPEMTDADNGKQGDQDAESGDDEDSGPDVDMDPDDEDPEVLAHFDRRLAMHMKLINKEKKTAKQRKIRAKFRFTQVSRVLSLIESVAKVLRMRIETAEEVDQRTLIVFLDLHARLYEFALTDDAENGRFLTQVTGIAAKQMMIPSSFFAGKIADSETVVEIATRFLQSIRECTCERKPSDEETRIVSKSAGCLIGTAAALTGDDYGQFLSIYKEFVRQALRSAGHFVNPGMLASFFRRAPAEASKLLKVVEESLQGDSMTKNLRTTASEIVVELAEAARQGSESGNKNLDKFWSGLQGFLKKSVNSENVKSWRPLAIANFVQAASHGIRGECFKDGGSVSGALAETVKTAPLNRHERLRLLKLLRIPRDGQSAKRKQSTVNDDVEEETKREEDETRSRPKKRSKRAQ